MPAERLFIGRVVELERLHAAVEDAISGRGHLLLVAGDPGIGKTRTMQRVGAHARERGAMVAFGRCAETREGAPPFWPWIQVLRGLSGGDRRAEEDRGGESSRLTVALADLTGHRVSQSPESGDHSDQARFRLFDSLTLSLQELARAGPPLMLLLDDLQWADRPSLALLRFLAGQIADDQILLAATYRDLEVHAGHPLADALPALRRELHCEQIALRGLPESEVSELLAALLGRDVSTSFARAVADETAGNPLFIEEIARSLREGRAPAANEHRFILENVRLPESVLDAVSLRISRLTATCRRALAIASVIGSDFDRALLARVWTDEALVVDAALDEACAAGVLRPGQRSRGRLEFSHALIREALYEEIPAAERLSLHLRLGGALEELQRAGAEAPLAEIAHHYLEGALAGSVEKAVDFAARAAEWALEQFAYEETAQYYSRALEALDLSDRPDEARRAALLLQLGDAQRRAGGLGRSKETFRRAADLAARIGAAETLARAALGVGGRYAAFEGGLFDPDLVRLLDRALRALGAGESPLRARVMGRLASALAFSERRAEAADLARKAVTMARGSGDPAALVEVLNTAHWATWSPDNLEERLSAIEEIIALADEVGDGMLASEGVGWSFYHRLEAGNVGGAAAALIAHGERAATLRQPFVTWSGLVHRTVFDLFQGRFAEAEKSIREAAQVGERSQNRNAVAVYGAQIAFLRASQGRLGDTRMLADMAKGIAEQYSRVPAQRCAVATLYAFLGDTGEARRHLDRLALADLSSLPRDHYWLGAVTSLCELAWLLRDEALAGILIDAVRSFTSRCSVMPFMMANGSMARPAALVAATLGRLEDAERLSREAIVANERMGAPAWAAYSRQTLAEMLIERGRSGDVDEAGALLRSTLETTESVGLTGERARGLLGRIGGTPRTPIGKPAARDGSGSDLGPRPAADPESIFRQEGDYWRIDFGGRSIAMKGGKGLAYLQRLLAEPDREFHALDLASDADAPSAGASRGGRSEGLSVARLGDAGEVLDPKARESYKLRIEELEEDFREADSFGDRERAARARAEIDFLAAELSRAFGLGGRSRRESDPAERARKAVSNRIWESITRIGTKHPELGHHLETTVRTGVFCAYRPPSSVEWTTRPAA